MAVLNAPLIRSRHNMTQNFALSVRVSIRAISHLRNVARISMKCQKESCNTAIRQTVTNCISI